MNTTTLPDRNSPDVRLVSLTPPEWLEVQKINSVEWKGPLTVEGYLHREYESTIQDLTRDGGLSAWALVWQTEHSNSRTILSACDTIKKRAFVATNGSIDEVTCHAVCAVFCPHEFRGHGYASRMMEDLDKTLAKFKAEKAFSILFSDIGKKFYAARGWKPFPSAHIALESSAVTTLPADVRLLTSADLPELCALDEQLLRKRLKCNTSQRTCVAIVPDLRTVRWHHAREEATFKEMMGRVAVVKGAICDEQPGHRVFAYWTMFFGDPNDANDHNELTVLRIMIEDDDDHDFGPATAQSVETLQNRPCDTTRALAAVLAAAQTEAAQWNMDRVVIWNPSSVTLAAAQQLEPKLSIQYRETKNIPSMRWYGNDVNESIDWVYNEKYGWC